MNLYSGTVRCLGFGSLWRLSRGTASRSGVIIPSLINTTGFYGNGRKRGNWTDYGYVRIPISELRDVQHQGDLIKKCFSFVFTSRITGSILLLWRCSSPDANPSHKLICKNNTDTISPEQTCTEQCITVCRSFRNGLEETLLLCPLSYRADDL